MVRTVIVCAAMAILVFVPACMGHAKSWSNEDAMAAEQVEMALDARGRPTEVEYHISPDQVPEAVRQAMDKLHPGGAYSGAEKEWNDGKLYYELTRKVKGMDVEAMFTPEGVLHQEEIQVAENTVPGAVQTAARSSVSGARVAKWEEIRGPDRNLIEYHVKMQTRGRKYKVIVSLDGQVMAVYRETPAEIEIPR
ncbi:MAG: hypothetical protein ACYTEZ_01655 [Planctomycetota bacterium]|jgi:hypothetical protein